MTRLFQASEIHPEILQRRTVAILGYGSQGRAHALNLREGGLRVLVGCRPDGQGFRSAGADGFEPLSPGAAVAQADLVAMLTPDMTQADLFREQVQPNLKPGAALLFAHGFNIHYRRIEPQAGHDVILVAPKAPGSLVRRQFEQGRGVPCLIAVHADASGLALDLALAYAAALGGSHAGLLETTFAEETETDLFGEQAVLCGGVTELVQAGFDTLVQAGYQPEIAYYECLHELKLIVDLIYEGGFARMHQFVSDTAKYGDLTRGPRIIDGAVRSRMGEILAEIRDGRFAAEWEKEHRRGLSRYRALQQADLGHPIESVGRRLRARMSWLQPQAEAVS
jgi:ketol-acid reductoisomerase